MLQLAQTTVAALLTCHNRVEKTLACLESLFRSHEERLVKLDVYLVDDGCTDGTGDLVREKFPFVNVIQGNGTLFWCGGMRLAWEMAARVKDYDFYLWLNDDVVLEEAFFEKLLREYEYIYEQFGPGVVTGSCRDPQTGEFTYGGFLKRRPLPPKGKPEQCRFVHGNILLVPKEVYQSIGGMSPDYQHGCGDCDYGFRAQKAGIMCWASGCYLGACKAHVVKAPWFSPAVPLAKRLSYIKAPTGLNMNDFIQFRKNHHRATWMLDVFKAYLQVWFPHPFSFYASCIYPRLVNIRHKISK